MSFPRKARTFPPVMDTILSENSSALCTGTLAFTETLSENSHSGRPARMSENFGWKALNEA